MVYIFQSFLLAAAVLLSWTAVSGQTLPTCVYISSYHKGYDWSDGIEASLRKVLDGHCLFIPFYLDTKRNTERSWILQQAKEAKEIIEKNAADVVITSDDNAAKFVIQKYFKDSSIPFVFCGVNWTAKEYGFPYKNVTGMIEVTPVGQLLELAVSISKGNRGIFLGEDTITENKDLAHYLKYAEKNNIELDKALVQSSSDWKKRYRQAQKTEDFIILGNNSTIDGWDDADIQGFQAKHSGALVLTAYRRMVPFSMVGLVIKSEEQGKWAGEAALGVLQGFPIEKIAITANRSWSCWMNPVLLEAATITLPEEFVEKAQKLIVD